MSGGKLTVLDKQLPIPEGYAGSRGQVDGIHPGQHSPRHLSFAMNSFTVGARQGAVVAANVQKQ